MWQLWGFVSTQWRIGMNGPTALDYNAMYAVADSLCLDVTPGVLRKIQALESATLDHWHKKQ